MSSFSFSGSWSRPSSPLVLPSVAVSEIVSAVSTKLVLFPAPVFAWVVLSLLLVSGRLVPKQLVVVVVAHVRSGFPERECE